MQRVDGISPLLPLRAEGATDSALVSSNGTVHLEVVVEAEVKCGGALLDEGRPGRRAGRRKARLAY